jgi:hypothetical protein
MAFKDCLNLKNAVTINRRIDTNDGMGGFSSTTSTTIIPLCALWQNNGSNRFISDKYALSSTHILCFEYGAYNFNSPDASGGTVLETISYKNETYNISGFQNNYLELNEIVTQGLERIS